ncbi:16S rRNA (guanine(966)-N(2))-methyltransferase RsmD [Candidatus Gastranaerophilales bacterium]|nr:MAG: 16S rRNA (guanine(966)-N(2))-methyltransferase RsmD [Candidatus Gastranaerophilales bacterium]
MNITAGIFKGQKIMAPDEKITRPTLSKVRMSVFNTLQAMIDFEGSSFLDMYAGSGIMGLEALSRGFSKAVAFEKHPKAAQIIKNNYKKFNPSPELIQGDALKLTGRLNKNFDVIYIDPPYFSGIYEDSLNAIKNFTGAIVILEHVTEIKFDDFEVLKHKKYGDKFVTFLKAKLQ